RDGQQRQEVCRAPPRRPQPGWKGRAVIRNRRPRLTTGIEIDTRTLRIAQVLSGPEGSVLQALHERELPEGLFEDGNPTDPKTLAKELRALIKENGLKVATAHVNAGNEASILRLITPPPVQ